MNSKIETELNYRLNLACIKLSDFKRILSYILEDKAFEEPDDWEEFTQTFISLLCALKQDIQNHVNPLSLNENKKWFEVNKIITNTLSTIEPVKSYSSINGTTDTYSELLNQLDKNIIELKSGIDNSSSFLTLTTSDFIGTKFTPISDTK